MSLQIRGSVRYVGLVGPNPRLADLISRASTVFGTPVGDDTTIRLGLWWIVYH